MPLYNKDAPCRLYRDAGDKYTPWSLHLGAKKIAGYKLETQTGTCVTFENAYNDTAAVSITGTAQYPFNLISCERNLWNGTSEVGTLNAETGLPQASGSLRRTFFIPANGNTLYKTQRTINSGTYWGMFAYDENRNLLARSGQTVAWRVAWTTPINTKFLRFFFNGTNDGQITLYQIIPAQADILEPYETYHGQTVTISSGENFSIPTYYPITNIFTDAVPPLTLNCTARVADL